jgi:hypothetical protein
MRANSFAAMLVASALFSASCGFADAVRGNGKIETERRDVSAFTSVSVSGSGTLRVHEGSRKVEIIADSNILPYITTEVSGGVLKIGFKPLTSITRATKMEYDVTVPSLEGVHLSGSGDAYVDAFSGDRFSASISGSGGVKADLDYDSIELSASGSGGYDVELATKSLSASCSGSGKFYLKGAADKAGFAISGSGSVMARNLSAKKADVRVVGSGSVEIRAADELKAALSGSGDVRYWGNPKVDSRVAGSGRVKRAGD